MCKQKQKCIFYGVERKKFIYSKIPEGVVDIADLGLIDFFTCFFCQHWEPPGLLLPLMAV